MKMKLRILAILVAFMIILPSFFPSEQAQENELVLRVAVQDDMKGTNPITVSDVWSWNVLGFLFDSPMNFDKETDKFTPYIAIGSAAISGKADGWADCAIGNFGYSPESAWANSTKQETIIFYDFENVKWHDGHQMDVRDILFSMHLAGQVPEWSSSVNPLKDKGGRDGSNYSTTSWLHVYKVWESPDGMQAALRFQLQEPFADFFKSTLATFLLPEHIWNSIPAGQPSDAKIWCDPDYASNPWQVAAAQSYENNPPIGSGPFKFEFWEKGQMSKTSTWREHFFREDYKYTSYVQNEFGESLARQPNIDAITYKIFKTAEAAVLALKSDDIDYIAWSVPPTFVQELANEPGVALQQSPENGFTHLAFNMRRPSFGYNATGEDVGKPFRQAVAHCIDKYRIMTRLIQLGIVGTGPISSVSDWYNESVPAYSFDPDEAKQILADAGYKVDVDGTLLSGEDALAAVNGWSGHWWVNPNGTPIGSRPDGLIKIYVPAGSYTLEPPVIACNMIAQQLRDIGIYAESVALDFGSLIGLIGAEQYTTPGEHNFDMFLLSWRIGDEPSEFLHAFFHSSQSEIGQNYAGYQNNSFDEIIDLARSTEDPVVKKKAIFDAQAAICYDLPYDVLYYKTNTETYRSDRFTGWVVGDAGSIFCWESILNIQAPSPFKVIAQFVSPPSAIVANSTTQITVFVKDQDGNPLQGARVKLNASVGKLAAEIGNTSSTGKFTTTYTAPYANPFDPEVLANGTSAIIQIVFASYISPEGTRYDPAPSRLTVIKIFPESAVFLSVSMSADPDIIDPDVAEDGTLGFTYVDVIVTDQDRLPVQGVSVALAAIPAVPSIEPIDQLTDADGKARFRVTSGNLSNDDGSIKEYVLRAIAIHPTDVNLRGENLMSISIVDAMIGAPPPVHFPITELAIAIGSAFLIVFALAVIIHHKKKS